MFDFALEVPKKALEIGAIRLDPEQGFKWTKGNIMPIYCDMRRFQSFPDARGILANGMINLLMEEGLSPHYIVGTPTAGIAPATMLARRSRKPLLGFDGENFFDYKIKPQKERPRKRRDICAIVSNSPHGIPDGVSIADESVLPFMYVRKENKGHGLGKKIEGLRDDIRGNVDFIARYTVDEKSYDREAIRSIEEGGQMRVLNQDTEFYRRKEPVDVRGKEVLVVEDLTSTGGSAFEILQNLRNRGAIVNNVISGFSYELSKAVRLSGEERYNIIPVSSYRHLMSAAEQSGEFSAEQMRALESWRSDPFGWAKKVGLEK